MLICRAFILHLTHYPCFSEHTMLIFSWGRLRIFWQVFCLTLFPFLSFCFLSFSLSSLPSSSLSTPLCWPPLCHWNFVGPSIYIFYCISPKIKRNSILVQPGYVLCFLHKFHNMFLTSKITYRATNPKICKDICCPLLALKLRYCVNLQFYQIQQTILYLKKYNSDFWCYEGNEKNTNVK